MIFCVETARTNLEYSLSCIMLSLKNNHTDAYACPFVITPSNTPFHTRKNDCEHAVRIYELSIRNLFSLELVCGI